MNAPPNPPAPPYKPDDAECCHRGCSPCIFDYYADAMERREKRVRALGADPDAVLKAHGRER
jgi:hypothetical protein